MKADFEWQVGNDSGQWETIASREARPKGQWLRRVPRWVWCVLTVVTILAAMAGYLSLRQRYRQARDQMAFQIQSVIDVEAEAYAQGQFDRFAAQQDETAPDWYEYQKSRFQASCVRDRCTPILPAELQEVDPRGDIARVEVIEGQSAVRRVRFYRRTDGGWKHTAPADFFWRVPVELTYGDTIFLYHRQDEPHVDSLTQHIHETFEAVCFELRCPPHISLSIAFSTTPHLKGPGYVPKEGKLVLLSPWLAGIPVSGGWDASYLQELTYWTAYATFLQPLRHTMTPEADTLQRALADEYATWRSQQDWVETPLLRRIVSEQGDGALSTIFHDLAESRSLGAFLERWLSLAPGTQPSTYFEVLLNIEREAMLAGRLDTFLLLQVDDQEWQAHQTRAFGEVQLDRQSAPRSPVRVEDVEITGDRARVTLEGPATTYDGQSLSPDHVVHFLRQKDDWKHASPTYLVAQDPIDPAATSVTPQPAPVAGRSP